MYNSKTYRYKRHKTLIRDSNNPKSVLDVVFLNKKAFF